MSEKTSGGPMLRRDLVRLVTLAAGSAALTACGVNATRLPGTPEVSPTPLTKPPEFPTAVPTPPEASPTTPRALVSPTEISKVTVVPPTATMAPKPTEAPTATAVPSLEKQPTTITVVTEFANAMKAVGVTTTPEQILQQGLITKEITGKDGKKYKIASTQDGYPLMIKMEGGEWKSGLKDFTGKKIGATASYLSSKGGYGLWEKNFNIYFTENDFNWNKSESTQGQLDANRMKNIKNETIGKMGKEFGMGVVAKNIINWETYPKYITDERDPAKLKTLIEQHVSLLMKTYPEIKVWEMVNEYHKTGPNPDYLKNILGDEYVMIAFRVARSQRPDAKLMLNDNALPDKALIEKLKSEGLIDMIGIHMHLDEKGLSGAIAGQTLTEDELIKYLSQYGLPIWITELDVNIKNLDPNDPGRLLKQAKIFADAVNVSNKMGDMCPVINMWGAMDKYSWYEVPGGSPAARSSPNADPTLFFDNGSPKPAYFEVIKALAGTP